MEDISKPDSSCKRNDGEKIYKSIMASEKEYMYSLMKKLREENILLRKKLEITNRIATQQGYHIRELERLIKAFEQEPPSLSYEDFMFNHFNPRGLTQAAYAAYLSSVRSAFHARQSMIFSEKAVSVLSMVTSSCLKKQSNTSSDNLYDNPRPSTSSDINSSFCFQLEDDRQKEKLDNNKREELKSSSNDTNFADNERERELQSCSTNNALSQGELLSSDDISSDNNRRLTDLQSCNSNSMLDNRRVKELPSKGTCNNNRRQRDLEMEDKETNDNGKQRERELPSRRFDVTRKKRERESSDSRLNDFRKLRKTTFGSGSRSDESKEKEKTKLRCQTSYKAPAFHQMECAASSSRNNTHNSNDDGLCRVQEKIHFNAHLPSSPFQCGTPTILTPSTSFQFFRRGEYLRSPEKKQFRAIIRCKTENSKLNFSDSELSRNTFQTNRKVNNLKKKRKPNAVQNKEIKVNQEALRKSAKKLRTKKKKNIRKAGRKGVHDSIMPKDSFIESYKMTDLKNNTKMLPQIMLIDIFNDPNAANDPYVNKIKQDLGLILDDPKCPVIDDDVGNEEDPTFSNLEGYDGTNESSDIDNEKATADSVCSFSEENVDYQDASENKMLSAGSIPDSDQSIEQEDEKAQLSKENIPNSDQCMEQEDENVELIQSIPNSDRCTEQEYEKAQLTKEDVPNSDQCMEQEDEKAQDKFPVANGVLSEDSSTVFMDEPCCSKDPQSFWCSAAPENPPRKGPRTPPHPPPDYSDEEEDVYDCGTDYYYDESED